jgi:hypothetical protein
MISAVFISGVLIGGIVGWAISAWCHATTIAQPVEQQVHWTTVGGQNTNESVDADWTRQILAQVADRFFEIRI